MFWHELRNSLLNAERRGRIDGRYADTSMVRLRRLSIICSGETDDREIMRLTRVHRLTAYDTSYLALAVREGCALASLDRCLNEAAAAEGVVTFV